MKKSTIFIVAFMFAFTAIAQVRWQNADDKFGSLPKGFQVFFSNDSLDGNPFIAYYAIVDLNNKKLKPEVDTSKDRRQMPGVFYERNEKPLLVVNTTFFSFATNRSLNLVVKNGKIVAWPEASIPLHGRDTFTYWHPFSSAIGFTKSKKPDIAWVYATGNTPKPLAMQYPLSALKDSVNAFDINTAKKYTEVPAYDSIGNPLADRHKLKEWNVEWAVGGGPVLVQNGVEAISNNFELKFRGNKGLEEKHPRTLIGYTAKNELIIMAIQGRFPKIAEGATLRQCATLMKNLGCIEAMNLDGGGSSCMLINGKETIKPSDGQGIQRPVPAVFIIKKSSK